MKKPIDEELERLLSAADANVSLLMRGMDSGEVLHAYRAEEAVSSASTIKVPILLAALEKVARGELALDQPVEVPAAEILDDSEVFDRGAEAQHTYPLWELLYWMIVLSDNSATNVLIGLLGFDAVNGLCRSLGLRSTVLARRMLDFEALRSGRNNMTSAADMSLVFEAVYRRSILTPELCGFAMGVLRRQRSFDKFQRYIADDIAVAHKTGGLDPEAGHDRVSHDAGIFLLGNIRYYLGVFVTGAPDDEQYAKRLIGSLSKAIYDCYKG